MLINKVHKNSYFDSVSLMVLSSNLSKGEGIIQASVMMGTPSNKQVMKDAGLLLPESEAATPQDMITAVHAASEAALEWAGEQIEAFLNRDAAEASGDDLEQYRPKGLDTALKQAPRCNIVSISIAGEYAAWEAEKALVQGKHVFLFSDNIDLETERRLKEKAASQGLFMMGPDCGTASINGTALGFCNRVAKGPIGLIGASGTGLQEVMCQIDLLGGGVSHAIGTGGRDFKPEIGGIMANLAYETLVDDPQTELIVVVSKPADSMLVARLLQRWSLLPKKPTVLCFVGITEGEKRAVVSQLDERAAGRFAWAGSLMEAAQLAVSLQRGTPEQASEAGGIALTGAMADSVGAGDDAAARSALDLLAGASAEAAAAEAAAANPAAAQAAIALKPGQRHIRGLYCGGTLCYEAVTMLYHAGEAVSSNVHFKEVTAVGEAAKGHVMIDFGDDEYTRGTPHPMIYPDIRNQAIAACGLLPDVGVVLFDVMLGYGAHENPCETLIEAVSEARKKAREAGFEQLFVAALCGTELDIQQAGKQQERLEQAGIRVFRGHAAAVKHAMDAVQSVKEAVK